MKRSLQVLAGISAIVIAAGSLCGCVPYVSMTVQTRDSQGNVIEQANVTSSDTNGRTFRVDDNGTIALTANAEDSGGLQALNIGGGFSCSRSVGGIGSVQQGTYSASDPKLPDQNPSSESFYHQFSVLCSGGTYSGTIHACAANANDGSSCTKDAAFQ